jgi:uncharacterized protein with GYD domain
MENNEQKLADLAEWISGSADEKIIEDLSAIIQEEDFITDEYVEWINMREDEKKALREMLDKVDYEMTLFVFGEKFYELMAIMNIYDPANLIEMGFPYDEYGGEVKTVIVQLKKGMSRRQIDEIVYDEFCYFLGTESSDNFHKLQHAAYDIYDWLNIQENWPDYPLERYQKQEL